MKVFWQKYIHWFLIDSVVIAVSLGLTIVARPYTTDIEILDLGLLGFFAIMVYYSVNHFFHLYQRIWRYASVGEVMVIALSVSASTTLVFLANLLFFRFSWFPLSELPTMVLSTYVGFVTVRYRSRLWTGFRWRWRQTLEGQFPTTRTQVLIVGAGEAGQLFAKKVLENKEGEGYDLWIVGFIDDDLHKHGMRIHGIPVRGGRDTIPEIVDQFGINLIVIAMNHVTGPDFRSILDICDQTSAAIKVIPSVFNMIQETTSLPPIRNVTSEDLLGRKPVEIDRNACYNLLHGKTVLVTGAAGSIGSELCRQINKYNPRRLLMLDNNESGLHDLVISVNNHDSDESRTENNSFSAVNTIIGDVTSEIGMGNVFETYKPQVVFHAAAYKHVPIMEDHPAEAVRVNVGGTKLVARLAGQYNAERFVLVSTDKAVHPYNVMGATKWLCELLVVNGLQRKKKESQNVTIGERNNTESTGSLGPDIPSFLRAFSSSDQRTLNTAVRFGNVLGSRGSVVPTFERQIDQGGPVTVTHHDMTRYFMSIPEAASLIIQAAAFTQGDDIFMLDMGQQIRIDELARRLIRLRGLRPGVDVKIVYTGPRPGEKMTEKLLAEGEELYPTQHSQIFRIKSNGIPWCIVTENQIDGLISIAKAYRNEEVTAMLNDLAIKVSSQKMKEKPRRVV